MKSGAAGGEDRIWHKVEQVLREREARVLRMQVDGLDRLW